jgi:hypothetical protein
LSINSYLAGQEILCFYGMGCASPCSEKPHKLKVIITKLMKEGRGVYRILIGRPEGKRPLGRPRRR